MDTKEQERRQAALDAMVDIATDGDPSTAATMAIRHKMADDFLHTLCDRCGDQGVDWRCLLVVAGMVGNIAPVVRLATNTLRRRELVATLLRFGEEGNEDEVVAPQGLYGNPAACAELFSVMTREQLESLAERTGYSFAVRAITAHYGARVEHFVANGDLKRAVDTLVTMADVFMANWGAQTLRSPGPHASIFNMMVLRVWEEHRSRGLVQVWPLEPGAPDWRTSTWDRPIIFGRMARGNGRGPGVPKTERMMIPVPERRIWGQFVFYELPSRHLWSYGMTEWARAASADSNPNDVLIGEVGAKLRDIIWCHAVAAKKAEVARFCAKHELADPEWHAWEWTPGLSS